MLDNKLVRIEIMTSPLPLMEFFAKTFLIVLTIILILNLSIYFVKSREIGVVPEELEVRKELKENLEKFIKTYEEFIAVEVELDDFIKEKLTSRKSPRVIRETLAKFIRENKKLRDRLSIIGEKLNMDKEVYKVVSEMFSIEDKVEFTRRELISDWSQFLSGKIGKKELTLRARRAFNALKTYKINRTKLLNRLKNIYSIKYAKFARGKVGK